MNVSVNLREVWHGQEITADMAKELQTEFFNVAGRIVLDARSNIHNVSGELAASIRRARPRESTDPIAYVFAGNRREGVYWHGFVEYGTAKMAARPYLRPDVDAARFGLIRAVQRAAEKVLKKSRPGV